MMERFVGFKEWMLTDEGKGIFDVISLSLIIGVAIGILFTKTYGV
jgi:hypothetical protein